MSEENIQKIIELIENNVLEDYSLDDYAQMTGYSKFHLMRIFKRVTGYTFYNYILSRRITYASQYLLYTDMNIIELALMLNFQSQESFSRSFKSVYGLPPGKYRKLMNELSQINKEDIKMTTEHIKGWIITGTAPEMYEIKLDSKEYHSGHQCASIASIHEASSYNENTFGTLMQSLSSQNYKGKRIKFSAFVKTQDADKCGVWARVDDSKSDVLQFDNMKNRAITGTNDWNHYSVVLDISEVAESIHFGVLLIGQGKIWIVNFKVETVDLSVPSTNTLDQQHDLLVEPINLNFEDR